MATLRHKKQTRETFVGDCEPEWTSLESEGKANVNMIFSSSVGRVSTGEVCLQLMDDIEVLSTLPSQFNL